MNIREAYPNTPHSLYLWRSHLLSLLGDWDRVLKGIRSDEYPGRIYDEPQGGWRATPRPCTHCRQPTCCTTPRGRSVHPSCEGWIDSLSAEAEADLVFSIMQVIPIAEIEAAPCLFAPAHTLAAPDRTASRTSPATGSANGAGDG